MVIYQAIVSEGCSVVVYVLYSNNTIYLQMQSSLYYSHKLSDNQHIGIENNYLQDPQ